MLPEKVKNYMIRELPEDRQDYEVKKIVEKFNKLYTDDYTKNLILSKEDAKRVFKQIGIDPNKNRIFAEYYMHSSTDPESYYKDLLYGLNEIYENYQNPFWAKEYPNITDRYLQISSIEGESSYFYDKDTDAVYEVDWSQMDDFMAEKLKPRWKSFYDCLEWYYNEEDEK